jgi:NAD(P)H-hydrate epimerase
MQTKVQIQNKNLPPPRQAQGRQNLVSHFVQNKLLFPDILWEMPQNIYKRQRGKVFIIAGSKGMTGAAALTCEAAFRSGAGIVVLGFPEKLKDIYKQILPEAMTQPLPSTKTGSLSLQALDQIKQKIDDFDVIALGPGLSQNPETVQLSWELIFATPKPLILDADGIGALASGLKVIKQKKGIGEMEKYLTKRETQTIITPHPGEASKLLNALREKRIKPKTPEYVDKNRLQIAPSLSEKLKFIVVLKGANTVIANPKGQVVINKTGNPAMATAGMGDVLVGIISTLCAQNLEKIFEATATAVYLHGLAGDLACKKIGQRSIIASDIIKFLPKAIDKAESELK